MHRIIQHKRILDLLHWKLMPAITGSACAKSILFGEHAVVYGFPAIAVPIPDLKVRISITPDIKGVPNQVRVISKSIALDSNLDDMEKDSPIRYGIELTCDQAGAKHLPACTIRINSDFPAAGGLGSSASCAVALIRAVSNFLGLVFSNKVVNELAFQIEKIHHSNPSGVDNTVITYEKPVFFIKNKPLKFIKISKPLHLIFAFSGINGLTREAVELVRENYLKDQASYNQSFKEIGAITRLACENLSSGEIQLIGQLMSKNHELLKRIHVSIPSLDNLVTAALHAGALGAKLCGGGLGGNIVALVEEQSNENVRQALKSAGAFWTHSTIIQ